MQINEIIKIDKIAYCNRSLSSKHLFGRGIEQLKSKKQKYKGN